MGLGPSLMLARNDNSLLSHSCVILKLLSFQKIYYDRGRVAHQNVFARPVRVRKI